MHKTCCKAVNMVLAEQLAHWQAFVSADHQMGPLGTYVYLAGCRSAWCRSLNGRKLLAYHLSNLYESNGFSPSRHGQGTIRASSEAIHAHINI